MRRALVALAAVLVAAAGCRAPKPAGAQVTFTPGADGIGDTYFPTYGNGGYDVAGYALKLAYDPGSKQLSGTATITATATQNLSRFDLDLAHLTASAVTVDGQPAKHSATQDELVVTPSAGLVKGRGFTVVVTYGGIPQALRDPALGQGGWLATTDGAFAVGQPESASTWFPVNDHPADKATFALTMTVPDGLDVLSNGVPGPHARAAGRTTWTWTENTPMASYLTTVVIGHYRVTQTTHDGKPMIIATPESLPADSPGATSLAQTPEIADFLATQFGPYPFDAYGGILLNDPRVGYALETQTRPVYANAFFTSGPNPTVVAHELAHQWFGDSVALERWRDIWLNEGFATYAEWLWSDHVGARTVAQSFDDVYGDFRWDRPAEDPGAADLFGDAVYQRGAMTVYALRRTIGDDAFNRLLTTWTSQYRNGNATTADFIAAAEKVSGRDLGGFFQTWLYGTAKPRHP